MNHNAKVGAVALAIVAAASAAAGGCVASATHGDAIQEAFIKLRGTGNVPGVDQESATYGGLGFQPSDSPPRCLPNGTVTYEVWDGPAQMRYWVFRWPEDKGYSVVPRLTVDEDGNLVPYSPPRFEPTDDAEVEGALGDDDA